MAPTYDDKQDKSVTDINARNPRMRNGMFIAVLILCGAAELHADDLVIDSFSNTGQLSFRPLATTAVYRVEWASSLTGPWTNTWDNLASIMLTGNASVTCSVPMFYRVVANQNPENVMSLPGSATVTSQAGAPVIAGTIYNVFDGDFNAGWQHEIGTDSESSSGTSCHSWVNVAFDHPVFITSIRVKYSGYGRGDHSTGCVTLDQVPIPELGGTGEGFLTSTNKDGINQFATEVRVQVDSVASGNRNENPRYSRADFWELEVWALR